MLCSRCRSVDVHSKPMCAGRGPWAAFAAAAAMALAGPVHAGDRLLGTYGVTQVEGAAGGGLVPWAVIGGRGSSDQTGASVHVTYLSTQAGYALRAAGVAIGVRDRLELSLSRWSFRLGDVVPDRSLEMTTVGAKLRLVGDAVYDQDRWYPQVSVGVMHKQTADGGLVRSLGARDLAGNDVYVAATKLWLGAAGGLNVLANAAVRWTRANHFGLIGFGGPSQVGFRPMLEVSLGLMLRDDLVVGAEYRARPNALQTRDAATAALREEAAWDMFVAWFPLPYASLTAAWVNLGQIVGQRQQQGLYVSGQVGF